MGGRAWDRRRGRYVHGSAEKNYEQPERHDFCISRGTVVRAHKISALHSQSKFDAMVWSNILLIVSTSLQSKGSLRLGQFFPGSSIVRPIFTHMPVYQDAQLPTPFCFQPLPRKARALPWQHWPGNEASMFTDTSLVGRSAPSILRFASTVS